jgi:hypothetical protein
MRRADGDAPERATTICSQMELGRLADYLLEAHTSLLERGGLDGFRFDTVKHVGHDSWREYRRRIDRRLGEDFFLVGEVWGGDAQALDPLRFRRESATAEPQPRSGPRPRPAFSYVRGQVVQWHTPCIRGVARHWSTS